MRSLQGVAAGVILAATATLAYDAAPKVRPTLSGLWAGVLVASLLVMGPITLAVMTADWRDALRPLVWLLLLALAATVLLAVVRMRPETVTREDGDAGLRMLTPGLRLGIVITALAGIVLVEVASGVGVTLVAAVWLVLAAWIAVKPGATPRETPMRAALLTALVVGVTVVLIAQTAVGWGVFHDMAIGGSSPIAAARRPPPALAIAALVGLGAGLVAARSRRRRDVMRGGLAVMACAALATLPLNASLAALVASLVLLGLGASAALGAAAVAHEDAALPLGVCLLASGLAIGALLAMGSPGCWRLACRLWRTTGSRRSSPCLPPATGSRSV